MNAPPFIDWNGNGRLDPEDIAISLAIVEEQKDTEGEEDNDNVQ